MVESMSEMGSLLKGKEEIMKYFDMSPRSFMQFVELGLPARKMGATWYAHTVNLDEWSRAITRVKASQFIGEGD